MNTEYKDVKEEKAARRIFLDVLQFIRLGVSDADAESLVPLSQRSLRRCAIGLVTWLL